MQYSKFRHLYLGFHGCEKNLAKELITKNKEIQPSKNDYDWLGAGVYFWENDPVRALEFARDVKKCSEPFVIGAILDLGYCLDLTCRENTDLLKDVYDNIVKDLLAKGKVTHNKAGKGGINGDIMNLILYELVFGKVQNFTNRLDFVKKTTFKFVSEIRNVY